MLEHIRVLRRRQYFDSFLAIEHRFLRIRLELSTRIDQCSGRECRQMFVKNSKGIMPGGIDFLQGD